MAKISIAKLIFVLPVPVSPLSQGLAMLINTIPRETILITLTPSAIKAASVSKREKKAVGKILSSNTETKQSPKLHNVIFLIACSTSSCRF